MSSKTFRSIPKEQVLKACEDFIDSRMAYIERLQEPLIQQEMKPKLFGLIKAKTREEAKKALGRDLWNKYNLVKLHGGYDDSRVTEISALCKIPGEATVELCAEDARILANYF